MVLESCVIRHRVSIHEVKIVSIVFSFCTFDIVVSYSGVSKTNKVIIRNFVLFGRNSIG